MVEIHRHKAAIKRISFSKPIRLAIESKLISSETSVFDYGCGRGDDLRLLSKHQIECEGWDPTHKPENKFTESDIVNLGFVLNVIEDPKERVHTLKKAWKLTRSILIVSTLTTADRADGRGKPYGDGYLTTIGTFQKYFEHHELRDWLESIVDERPVSAAPGIFYLFRNETTRQSYLSTRYKRHTTSTKARVSDQLYDTHKELFESLESFIHDRGRPPAPLEDSQADALATEIGSIKQAYAVLRRVTGKEHWEKVKQDRTEDLLVYLALNQFEGRPKFGQLPIALQHDIKALLSNYTKACSKADELLYSIGDLEQLKTEMDNSPVGKDTPTALYVHTSAVDELPLLLRLYAGCAMTFVGQVAGANILKLRKDKPKVSFLSYPNFEKDPHPALVKSLSVDLQTFRFRVRRYSKDKNPPILHRKEEFISSSNPLYTKFSRLTAQEERYDLYEEPSTIGTRDGWARMLSGKHVLLKGHRVIRKKVQADT